VNPQLGPVSLLTPDATGDPSAEAGGAAFELADPPQESAMVTIDSWEVEVAAGFKAVVARGPAVADPETAFNDGLLHAQRGLDLISARNYNNLLIRRFDDDYLVWWSDRDGLTVRQVCVALYQFDVPQRKGLFMTRTAMLCHRPSPRTLNGTRAFDISVSHRHLTTYSTPTATRTWPLNQFSAASHRSVPMLQGEYLKEKETGSCAR
jgi:hypothetical protein